jgi:hypothetical protein
MVFPVDNVDDVLKAKNEGSNDAGFRADDQFIENLKKKEVEIDGNNCLFTQVFKIISELHKTQIIGNAIDIMKFYRDWSGNACNISKWGVYSTDSPKIANDAIKTDIDDMKKKFKVEEEEL